MLQNSFSRVRWLCALVVTLSLAVQAIPAHAENQWMVGGGARFSTSPYKGYTSWSPTPILGYEGEYAYIRGLQAGIKLFKLPWMEISAFAAFDPTSFHSRYTENRQLKQLDDRYEGLFAGVAARVLLPLGALHAKAAAEVLHNGGMTGEVGYSYRWQWNALEVTPSAGLRWYSAAYQQYYYGVSASQALRSGLSTYTPVDGIDPYVGLRLGYAFSERWNAMAGVDVAFLNAQVQNSPMTDKGARFTTYLALVYKF